MKGIMGSAWELNAEAVLFDIQSSAQNGKVSLLAS